VGAPPIQYLNRYRIEIAKRLLTDTGKSINDIARLVGIPDESYFSRIFRQHAGKTPKAFRGSGRK
jgi:YesN/AraC family two-component response regulator